MTTILQISSGQGPEECRRFVLLLADFMRKEALTSGLLWIPLTEHHSDESVSSLKFKVEGEILPFFKKSWEGTVQWIWKSSIRPNWPRKNWFVKVSFFDFGKDLSTLFKKEDLKIETFRSSGHGGQHVNTTDSAVRVTHLPTGLICVASEERSQTRNKELALLRLHERLNEFLGKQKLKQDETLWGDHYRLERGNPVRVFKGLPLK